MCECNPMIKSPYCDNCRPIVPWNEPAAPTEELPPIGAFERTDAVIVREAALHAAAIAFPKYDINYIVRCARDFECYLLTGAVR
jgi:hypothetical protein